MNNNKNELIEVVNNEIVRKSWDLISNNNVTSPMKYKKLIPWAKVIKGTVNLVSVVIYITKVIAQIILDLWIILELLWDEVNALAAKAQDAIINGAVILAEAYKDYSPVVTAKMKQLVQCLKQIVCKAGKVIALIKIKTTPVVISLKEKASIVLKGVKAKANKLLGRIKRNAIQLNIITLLVTMIASMAIEEYITSLADVLKGSWAFRQELIDDSKK